VLQGADRLFSRRLRSTPFDAAASQSTFRVAASDYLDPLFLPSLVTHIKRTAPGVQLELMPLTREYDYRRHLAHGDVDLVIGNWLRPPEELHLGRLISDDVVCLVAQSHPVATGRGWSVQKYFDCEHVAPMPMHPGALGVIDEHLAARGLKRRIAVRCAHFGLAPRMVADSRLVLTTGRQFCQRYLGRLPLRVVRCPAGFPPMAYFQLWHERAHAAPAQRWLREQVRDVARTLAGSAA
jgi:DNA-binding transcriptional LysR family regulator